MPIQDTLVSIVEKNYILSTGIVEGGLITVNGGDPTKFDISAGYGYIVDKYTNPGNVTQTLVNWTSKTAVTPVWNSLPSIFIGIDSSGNVVIQNADFSPLQLTTTFRIGRVFTLDGINIASALYLPIFCWENPLEVILGNSIGQVLKISGNIVTENGNNLKLDKTLGVSVRHGANAINEPLSPHTPTTPIFSPVYFVPVYISATGGIIPQAVTSDLNPTQWDDLSGTLQTVPPNKYTTQIMKFYPYNSTATIFVGYGQKLYSTLTDAIDDLSRYVTNKLYEPEGIEGAINLCTITFREDVTDLAAAILAGEAKIVNCNKYGQL